MDLNPYPPPGRQASVPGLPQLAACFMADVLLGPERDHGMTCAGRRLHVRITGGRVWGPGLNAKVLPGGVDWQLLRADGMLELEAIYDLKADDGSLIHVRNRGLWASPTGDWPASYAMSQPRFEAPEGPHSWLNRYQFLATVGPGPVPARSVHLRFFQVLMD